MSFWGIEVKPDTPYVYRSDDEGGRLHVSQATLGDGSSSKKSILQCKVGDNKPIYLCSLLPKRLETCQLNLEFEEEEEVTFSIVGAHSVHLSGFFYGDSDDQDYPGHDCDSDSGDEDFMASGSEDEDGSEDDDDDGFEMYPPSPVHNSGVKIEEIVDDEKANNENDSSKRAKRKKSEYALIKGNTGDPILESEDEDEDGFPISANQKKTDTSKAQTKLKETSGEKTQKKSDKGDKLKRKIDTVDQDGKHARESIELGGSAVQTDTTIPENIEVGNKNKKLKVSEKVETGLPNSNVTVKTGIDLNPSSEKKNEKKKKKEKKKKNKQPESGSTPSTEGKSTKENGLVLEKKEKKVAKSQVRTYPNGLMIEEMAMGKPDGKRASRGKKVRVHYIGKLQKNGKIFDSNIGRAPLEFRLGIGKVIKGWDVGVEGMRVGDKRRLTIPPAMGYGATGAGPIPPNAWLNFDVELVEVN